MAEVQIQIRRGTAAEWTSANPQLALAELGWETDTNKMKFGDGTSNWVDLPYSPALFPFVGTGEGVATNDLQYGTFDVPNDGTPSAGWPNRWEFTYEENLVQWFNEYQEWRGIPAKGSTVGWRLHASATAADPHNTDSPVAEIVDNRSDKNPLWQVYSTGDAYLHRDLAIDGSINGIAFKGRYTEGDPDPVEPGVYLYKPTA